MSETLEYRVRPVTRFIVTEYDSRAKVSTVIAEVDGGGTADRIAEAFAQKACPQLGVTVSVDKVGTADEPSCPNRFRKKPVVIEAVRWRGYSSNLGITAEPADQPVEITPENMHGITWAPLPDWLPKPLLECVRGERGSRCPALAGEILRDGEFLYIGTLEGEMCAGPGDWIIRGVKGEIYPCKPDIFAATYEAA